MPIHWDAFDQQVGLTNAPLMEHETKHIKARLRTRRYQLQGIENNLRNASNRGELLEDRNQIIAIISKYQNALAPHKRLPTELLQVIFHHVCVGYEGSHPRARDPPLLLSRICSLWRRTVIQMPELWTSLHFSVHGTSMRSQKLRAAQTYFSRAAGLPLSLTLSDPEGDPSPPVDFIKNLISPFSGYFRYLHLIFRSPQMEDLFSLPLGSLDALEEFHVVYDVPRTSTSPSTFWSTPIALFSPLAKLRRLRIQLTPFVTSRIFTLPWHTLETFRCDSSLQSEDCHQLFLSCYNLRKIHVRIFGIRYSTPFPFEVRLSYLVSLSVQLCDEESYDLFFLPLILPALRCLFIYNYNGLPWSPGMYNGLLERSGCEIEEIYLGTVDADTHDIVRLFELSPTLKSVTISHNTFLPRDILLRVGRAEIGGMLQQLFLKGPRDLDSLLTMLEVRQRKFPSVVSSQGIRLTTSPLKFIETSCDQVAMLANANRIQRLRDSGIEISFLSSAEGHFHL